MKQTIKKFVSISVAAALVAGSIAACSSDKDDKKSKKDKDDDDKEELNGDIEDAVSDYLDAMIKADFDKSGDLVDGRSAKEPELDDDAEEVRALILKTVKYEVTEAEGDEDDEEGTATVKVTYADYSDIDTEGLDIDGFGDALKDADESEEEIEIDLVYDDDWLIDADSDEDLVDFFFNLGADVELSGAGVYAKAAAELAADYVSAARDTDEAKLTEICGGSLSSNTQIPTTLADADGDQKALYDAYLAAMTADIDESDCTVNDDGSVDVKVTGTVPDLNALFKTITEDDTIMVPVVADAIAASLNGTSVDNEKIEKTFYDEIIKAMKSGSETRDYESVITVSVEDGKAYVSDSDFFEKISPEEFDDSILSSDLMMAYAPAALDQLLADGTIDQAKYDELMASLDDNGGTNPTPAPSGDIKPVAGPLSDDSAKLAVEAFMSALKQGDFESATALSTADFSSVLDPSSYEAFGDDGEKIMRTFLANYFASADYELSIKDSSSSSVTVVLNGKIGNVSAAFNTVMTDKNIGGKIFGEQLILPLINGQSYDEQAAVGQLIAAVGDALLTGTDKEDLTIEFVVTEGSDGNLIVAPSSDFEPDLSGLENMSDEQTMQIMLAACDYLHDNGQLDDTTYEALKSSLAAQ